MTEDHANIKSTLRSYGVCVLIPTYNNSSTLATVVESVLEYADDVIVVNDGSTDNTSHILQQFGDRIQVVAYQKNRGKGYALKQGFRYAIDKGFNYAITIDSDGQHYAKDIPNFARAIVENYGALIIGERDLSGVAINGKSSFANKFSNFWFMVQTCRKLNDTQTGYRAYPLHKLSGLGLLTSRYEAELELMVFAAWAGTEIVSIPISVYYPPQSERISHFRPAKDFTRISILNTILCIGAIVYGGPRMVWEAFRQRKLFNREWKYFTYKRDKNGEKERRECAKTLGRMMQSFFGFGVFGVLAQMIFTPVAILMFSVGKSGNDKRYRFHRILQSAGKFLCDNFPYGNVEIDNPEGEDFEKPALIIANHQSHLDLPTMMALNPKLIFLTNDWVWNNKIFGAIIHRADYLPVSAGIERILPKLKKLVSEGYSVVVYPEGTRSEDCRVRRFHKGAFLLADELKLDIVPMVLHGAGHYLKKHELLFRRGTITLKILPRFEREEIEAQELDFRKQASHFKSLIESTHLQLKEDNEDAEYFHYDVYYRYVWRGWYILSRAKQLLKRRHMYEDAINDVSPEVKNIRILNGGIGVLPLFYAMVHEDKEIYAYIDNLKDYQIASGTAGLPKNLHYVHSTTDADYEDGINYDLQVLIDPDKKQMKRFAKYHPQVIEIMTDE